MQVELEKIILEDALSTVSRAVNPRSPLPILSHLHLEAKEDFLVVQATDLDLGLRMAIPARVAQPGAVCVPAKLFTDIIAKFPGAPVGLDASTEGRIKIHCGRSKFEVQTLPAEEYPRLPVPEAHPDIDLPQKTFKRMVAHVIKVPAPADESRAVMTGVLFEIAQDQLVMVATDGRRLAYGQHRLPDGLNQQASVVVPGKAMLEVARACTSDEDMLKMRIGEGQVWAQTANLWMCCRLLQGSLPDHKRVIPNEFLRSCRVGREALVAALRRVLIVSTDMASPGLVVLDFDGDQLVLSANTPDVGLATEEMPCIYEGKALRIAFNGRYVLDALLALACEEVEVDLQCDTRSAVVREYGETDFLHVLMPVRLREAVPEEGEPVGAHPS